MDRSPTSLSPSIGSTAPLLSSMSSHELTPSARRQHAPSPPLPGSALGIISSFEEGSLRLDLRFAVAVRRVSTRAEALFYLSLFDDEIDSRLEEFLAFASRTTWTEPVLAAAA